MQAQDIPPRSVPGEVFDLETFEPKEPEAWAEALQRFQPLMNAY
jgi:hypothetical protein